MCTLLGQGEGDPWDGIVQGSEDGRKGDFRHPVRNFWPGECRYLARYTAWEEKQSPEPNGGLRFRPTRVLNPLAA